MFVRILIVIIALLFIPVGHDAYYLHNIKALRKKPNPDEAISAERASLNVEMFFDYSCEYCRQIYPIAKEAAELDRDVRSVVKPTDGMDDQSGRAR